MKVCIVQPKLGAVTETFLRAHAEQIAGVVAVIHHNESGLPSINNTPILSQSAPNRAARKLKRVAARRQWQWEITISYLAAFRRLKCDVVLAQYGPTGLEVMEACRIAGIPLVVHFHGYDASRRDILERHKNRLPELLRQATAVIAVSKPMRRRLIDLGATDDKVHLNHYGVDIKKFSKASPAEMPPTFLATGRLVNKKAPHLTILAFAKVREHYSAAKLNIIGDGPLRGVCEDLIYCLQLGDSVQMLGAQSHEYVANEMQRARAFVQHSVEAVDGDCEGLPNSILEASASGLPVIATRHAGIPEAVIDQKTGLLVDERDKDGMAQAMMSLAGDPALAGELGLAGRKHIIEHFTLEQKLQRLKEILEMSIAAPRM